MTLTLPKGHFTYRDYQQFPDYPRMELIDGDFLMSPSPNTKHQRVSRKLEEILASWVKKHNLGEIFQAPYDVVLSHKNVVQPDILFVSKARKKIITEANIKGSPDLVIEIVSPGNMAKDLFVKKALYEKYKILEYWIVNPHAETVTVMTLQSGNFHGQTYTAQNTLKPNIFLGLIFPVKEIFENR